VRQGSDAAVCQITFSVRLTGPGQVELGQSISNLWRLGELKAGGGIFQKGKVMEEKGKNTEDRRQEAGGEASFRVVRNLGAMGIFIISWDEDAAHPK
jgi:hypothetical protein